jgi:RimJ/RimL family protein N-acetyltransferase
MKLELNTDRLLLRPFIAADLDSSLELFTNPEVVRYAGGVMSEAAIHAQLPNWSKRGGNGCIGIWTITDSDSGEKHGSIALLPMPVEEDDTDYTRRVAGITTNLTSSAWN